MSAQNPDLLNTNWQITKVVTASGQNILPPPMPYQQNTTFSTNYPELNSTFFNTIYADLTYTGQDNFAVNSRACTLGDYVGDNGAVNQFFNFICDFYLISGTFFYYIQNNGIQKTMIISNSLFAEIHFFSAVLGTNETESSQISIAPNPVENTLFLQNSIEIKSYKIYNQSGKLIDYKKNINAKTLKIDIQNYQTGVYFIKLNDDKSIKFIKK